MRNFNKPKSNKMKHLIVLFSIILVVVLLASVLLNHYNIFTKDISVVTGISVKMINENMAELKIKYQFPVGGYSVRVVPEDEGEYTGDGMVDYDGSLGKYRMMVDFGDVELSTAMSLKFSAGEMIAKSSPIEMRAKVVHPSDHGFVLYLGFDEPISLENIELGKMDQEIGSIRIPIKIENQ